MLIILHIRRILCYKYKQVIGIPHYLEKTIY